MAPFKGARGITQERAMRTLFNKRHASLRNIIERTFGVLKKQFPIFKGPMQKYMMVTQNNIVLACCALHNFIPEYVPNDAYFVEEEADIALADNINPFNPMPAAQAPDMSAVGIAEWNESRKAIADMMLQFALVVASRKVASVHQFFSNLVFIINIVTISSKCNDNDELKEAQAIEVATKIANGELETGRELNQIGTLKRVGDTRWGSHLDSISSLLKMFNPTCVVLSNIAVDGGSYSQRGYANFVLNQLLSFKFVFTLHLMKDIVEITHLFCIALQRKSQDILNAMYLVSSITKLLKNFRDSGWDDFLVTVKLFFEQHQIDIPCMNAQYIARRGRSRSHHDEINVEHYYQMDIFLATIDYQLQELHSRFNDHTVELLVLNTALDPRNGFMLFKIDDICKLAKKFYPNDFMEQELVHLRIELQHFELDIPNHPELQELFGIHELCQDLVNTRKSVIYSLIDRLIRLVFTLPVSTAITECAFSIMKIIQTKLQNEMEDNFLNDCLTVYIEKKVTKKFSSDSIIDEFSSRKERRAQFTSKKRC
ncbi:uncharacterized protein [Coffea arabica]|uniref:DDE Tnp4 domain-containing protein n=1 Tax=Coffea arabica TaxID=13443 RepID=A0ABM4V9T8_COFAR